MSSPSIKVVLPLADAHTNRRTGGKAICLSKLIAARFAVPKGFVLSADAYRSHLWASGAREIASSRAEAEQREAIRAAILAQPIPDDVWQSVAKAYERLSWQIGVAEPKVAVRSSALEDSRGGAGFAGAYESYLNVSGLENLDAAIKRVWASLWSGKAAAYRARYGSPTEPAMGVIVQQMVEADMTGSAFTANPVTGDPHGVCVIVREEGQSSQYTVSLNDFSVMQAAGAASAQPPEHPEPVEGRVQAVKNIAEQSVLIEDAIGGRVEVEWALDRDGLWMLQAGPITDLPIYFPAGTAGDVTLVIDDARTISHLGRSLIGHDPQVRIVNGYLYSRHAKQPEPLEGREVAGLMKESEKHLPALRDRASQQVNADLASLDLSALSAALKSAAEDIRASYSFMRKAERLSEASVTTLADAVGDSTMLRRLLGGVRDVVFERDALLQELSERFAIAEKSGKLEDQKWWRGYKSDVEQFAREYGYSFKDAGEAADPARWRSWIEDPDSVFRMIGAISKRGSKPTLITLHGAEEQDSVAAAAEALAQAGGKHAHLKRLLESARGLLCLRSATEQTCALASTALRRLLVEYAGRLEHAGLISSREDIFHLEIDELMGITAEREYVTRQELAAKVARRKHAQWLEQRLTPPETLPSGDGDPSESPQPMENKLSGSAGVVSGRARVVSSIEEAAEIENGDILITASASAAWTPFLAIAGGLICESGSEFSPAAILARTYAVPAVVGCKGALATIKDGQRINVDGVVGTVG